MDENHERADRQGMQRQRPRDEPIGRPGMRARRCRCERGVRGKMEINRAAVIGRSKPAQRWPLSRHSGDYTPG